MIPKHIKSYSDLQTTHKATVQGFLEQAIAKVNKANPYIKKGLDFYNALKQIKTLDDVLNLNGFKNELIAASGFSDKSKSRFSDPELHDSLKKVLLKIFASSKDDFREELVFRYLLTKGDSLGGSMRNITGSLASEKLIKIIDAKLKFKNKNPIYTTSKSDKIKSIKWGNRILLFDIKPSFIGKSVDVILINNDNQSDEKTLINNPNNYIACGELKGGIDPAGADEHWKTANSALERIRTAFENKSMTIFLFFIGAAIEAAMAEEIYNQLQSGKLTHAANLTNEIQVNNLFDWLLNL